jgi:crotonobetainyl-CoA:carnitine CoA-transferase CaiB-like acyl-CoA transferase
MVQAAVPEASGTELATGAEPATGGGGALLGLRVLDLSRVLAGPLCTQMLADHGATVTKVESPSGDETRGWGPPFAEDGASAYFHGLNRNKRNVSLDLRTDAGRSVVRRLIAASDVVVENFKAGTMRRWGMDYDEDLAPAQPGLIYCRITGFGVDGPLGGLPGYDAVLQSYAGLMSVNGYPDRGPLRVGVPLVDLMTANLAFAGVLLALHDRSRSGVGQLVDIALLDAAVSLLHPHSATWLSTGIDPPRTGGAHPLVAPYQVFATRTGDFFVGAANDRQFSALLDVLGRPDLALDARFRDNASRVANRTALVDLLAELIGGWDREELSRRLLERGVPAAAVNGLGEALTSPQVLHRRMVLDEDGYRGVGVPIKLGRSGSARPRVAGAVGADRDELMTELGYDADEIRRLGLEGAFGPG